MSSDIPEYKAMSLHEYADRMNKHHKFCLELFSKSDEELKNLPPEWLELIERKITDVPDP